jgi:hypothetical protein
MTRNQVLAKLVERGSNPSRFAVANKYQPRTVQQTIKRYVGNPSRRPRGILTCKILRDLSNFIGQPVIDGVDDLLN